MRRHTIWGAMALVGFCLAGAVWSNPPAATHHHHGHPPGQRVDTYGTTVYVTSPEAVSFHWLHGHGAVWLSQDDRRYTTAMYQGSGAITLTGRPNGFGGYQTAEYEVHTDNPDTVVEMFHHPSPPPSK